MNFKTPPFSTQIENLDHCDFIPLRNMLVRTHLQDLKDVTNDVHYENYRCTKLAGVAGGSVDKSPNRVRQRGGGNLPRKEMRTSYNLLPLWQNPLAQIEEERKEHHNKLLKMEREMEEVFDRKASWLVGLLPLISLACEPDSTRNFTSQASPTIPVLWLAVVAARYGRPSIYSFPSSPRLGAGGRNTLHCCAETQLCKSLFSTVL